MNDKADLLKRISIEPGKCGGRPCLRETRMRVVDVLELLSAGADHAEILRDYPSLELEDILLEAPVFSAEERPAVLNLLESAYAEHRLEVAGPLLPFHAEAAFAAAR